MTDTENKTIELKDEELDAVVGGTGIFFLEKENQAKTPVKTEAKTPVKTKDKNEVIIII